MKIEAPELYGFVAEGENSFLAMMRDGVWYPMVFAKRSNAEAAMSDVREIAAMVGKRIALVRWSEPEVLAVIESEAGRA